MRDALVLFAIAAGLAVALRYPFAGILTWAWFALLTPHQMAYGVWGLQLNVIIAGVTIASILYSGAWRKFAIDRTTVILGLLAFWLWLSQVFSLDPENSATYFDRYIKQILFVILCVQTTNDPRRFAALVWMLVACMGYFALKGGLFTLATLGQFRVQGVPNTMLEDNNHMGIALATMLPLILYLRSVAKGPRVRMALVALFVAAIIAVIGTHSRGAFVALAVFAAFFWWRSRRKLTILAALTVVLVPAVAFMPSKWTERMTTIAEAGEDPSFMGRIDAWVINAKLAAEHPLTGAGLRNSYQKDIARSVDPMRAESAKAAHSIYFEMLGGTGYVGLAIYLSLLANAFLTARALQKSAAAPPWQKQFGYFSQMAIVVFGVGGATVSVEMWDGYLILIALIAAAARISQESPQALQPRAGWREQARGALRRRNTAPSISD